MTPLTIAEVSQPELSEVNPNNPDVLDFSGLVELARDAIMVHDLDWRLLYCNRGAESLYGRSFDELKDKDLRSELFLTEPSVLLACFQSLLAKGEWSGELSQKGSHDREVIVQSRWTLIRDHEGRPKSVLVINTDVTEQKRLQAQASQHQKLETIATMAGGIAHDLNNALSPVLMGVELLKMKVTDERGQKMLNTMAASARRGADIVKQVLAFGRGGDGDRTLIQLKQVLRDMQKVLKETYPANIDVQIEVENTRPILGVAAQVQKILTNLCSNAKNAQPNGGRIVLAAKDVTLSGAEAAKFVGAKTGNYVLLTVRDKGTGIAPEIIHRVFDPFFTTGEIGNGAGLGLSVVMTAVKVHGGFLDLQSTVGTGTTVNVYLPGVESAVPTSESGSIKPELLGKGETIMVVEDDVEVAELTSQLLTHYGYKVICAKHGADALALEHQFRDKINAVLIDMAMPVMDGPAAIRKLKSERPALPVLAMSGIISPELAKQRLAEYSLPFLAKPFSAEKLLEAVRRVLSPVAV